MKSWTRYLALVLGTLILFGTFEYHAQANPGGPTRRVMQIPRNATFSISVHGNPFLPLVVPEDKSNKATGNAAQIAAANAATPLGNETLLLCSTIIGGDNPQATFLLGDAHIYATTNTPIAALRVKEIRDGAVIFDDGSSIAQSNCAAPALNQSMNSILPTPEAPLPNGSTGQLFIGSPQSPRVYVPGPSGSAQNPYPGQQTYPAQTSSQNPAQTVPKPQTIAPIYNPYTTPAPAPASNNNNNQIPPYMIQRTPSP